MATRTRRGVPEPEHAADGGDIVWHLYRLAGEPLPEIPARALCGHVKTEPFEGKGIWGFRDSRCCVVCHDLFRQGHRP